MATVIVLSVAALCLIALGVLLHNIVMVKLEAAEHKLDLIYQAVTGDVSTAKADVTNILDHAIARVEAAPTAVVDAMKEA